MSNAASRRGPRRADCARWGGRRDAPPGSYVTHHGSRGLAYTAIALPRAVTYHARVRRSLEVDMTRCSPARPRRVSVATTIVLLSLALLRGQTFDLVIANGRVLDPESNLDAARWVGITGRTISAISSDRLTGRTTIDAAGAIVVPGFIDLHAHGQAADVYALRATDGVTTALELEVG